MPKLTQTYELAFPSKPVGISAYEWIYSSLRRQILEGLLRPGLRLPATRDLARQLSLSRGTIVEAFEQLKAEGYVSGTVGSGTYVSQVLPDALMHVPRSPLKTPRRPSRRRWSAFAKRVRLFPGFDNRPTRPFRTDIPALELFPMDLWSRICARRIRHASTKLLLGCEPLGFRALRKEIADYLVSSRGVKCSADQVAIVSGVQEAIDLVARLFVDPGDRVGLEDPGYPGAANVYEGAGAKLVFAAIDSGGMMLDPVALRRVRMVYLTPAHQFPTGSTMSIARRLAFIEWARRSGALIFEDDYDSEFRYSSRPVPAMQGLDPYGNVLFAGSFSKVLFPSLRLGYLIIPADLAEKFAAALSITARHMPLLEQAVLCDFLAEGHFARHIRRMRELYAERLAVLAESVREHLSGVFELSEIEAGLQTAGWLKPGIDSQAVAQAAAVRDLDVTPLSRFARRPMKRDGLQLGFAAITPREIRHGVSLLAGAIDDSIHATRRRL
jgi:GntR family transcriptional regulator / MocR family aminotransferase